MKGFPLMATSECTLTLLLGNNTLPLGQQLLPGYEFNMNFPFMPLSMSSKLMNVFTSLHFYPAFPSRSSENLYDSPQFLPKICIAKYFIKSEIYVFMSSKTHNCRATLKAPILLIPSCGKVNCQPEWGQWDWMYHSCNIQLSVCKHHLTHWDLLPSKHSWTCKDTWAVGVNELFFSLPCKVGAWSCSCWQHIVLQRVVCVFTFTRVGKYGFKPLFSLPIHWDMTAQSSGGGRRRRIT